MQQIQELPINSLDFDDIKNNFISFLKSQQDEEGNPIYQDYNFEGSGISTLLNILSYNTHYIGYYIKMLLNESFIDSAVQIESLYSKAKLQGYTPKSKTCAKVDLKLSVEIDLLNPLHNEPLSRSILIPKGTNFYAANTNNDQRIFYIIDNIYIKNIDYSIQNKAIYTSDIITIYEGQLHEWKFKIDYTLLNQRYIIQDKNIDINTIRILIIHEGMYSSEEYFLANSFLNIKSDSPIFYITTQEEGYYEIIFGNNIFGKKPSNNSIVYVNYINSNGEDGNGCKKFRFNAPSQDSIPIENNILNWDDFKIITDKNSISSGGVNAETVDNLRFTIPYHFRRQNRIVTDDDYRSILISEYRNIDSINIWGGEKNIRKDYGKVYISIKPKYIDKLTITAKKQIANDLLEKYCVVGTQPIFVDPEFVNVSVDLYARIDNKKTNLTSGEIEKQIIDTIIKYNNENLNVFDNYLSDVIMLDKIMNINTAIKTCYSKKRLDKDQEFIYNSGIINSIYIGNSIENGVRSTYFQYGNNICYFKDDIDGNLYIYKKSNNTKLLIKTFGNIDYKKGIINYSFPIYAKMIEKDFVDSGIINFQMTPSNPDIETYLQNIIRITSIRVILIGM